MTAGLFIDTNVLLYSISTVAAEADKRVRAEALLSRDDCGLSVQVLQEFYVQATRPSRSHPLPHAIAVGLIETWSRFAIQDNTVAVMREAQDIRQAHGFSFWDSAILAAAKQLGCRELHTEDLNHGQSVGGVTIVNPFI